MYKRLSFDGRFQWPRDSDEARDITPDQYRLLMNGFTLEGTV
ncbi:MAG: IS66 family insertion sequence element accessory protein TnpB, partial [Lachnospiraceae bacterium]|nr:IS66 family insertion sequence element accessory protein TnpB [Lachnospiraceae bacterium]